MRPGGEGVRVEELDAVAAWCSGAGEDDARNDQVMLPPHRRLWLRDDGGAPADGRPERINASGLEGGE
jgi:hypothetical protein